MDSNESSAGADVAMEVVPPGVPSSEGMEDVSLAEDPQYPRTVKVCFQVDANHKEVSDDDTNAAHATLLNFFKYTVGHLTLAFVCCFGPALIPLYDPTPGFSWQNQSFNLGFLPPFSMVAPWYQVMWYEEITEISWKKVFNQVVLKSPLSAILIMVVAQAIKQYPVPLLVPLSGVVVFLTFNAIMFYIIPLRLRKDLLTTEDERAFFRTHYRRFLKFIFSTGGFFAFSILYLFLFAYSHSIIGQIFIQFAYNLVAVIVKEYQFGLTRGNNLSIYFVEFAADFFTFMALPSVTSALTFSLNAALEVSGLLYQLIRLSHWWFKNIEEKYLIAIRNHVLGGGIIEELVAFIMFKSRRVIHVESPKRSKSLAELEKSNQVSWRGFQRNVCRTMVMTALCKIFSPLLFTFYFVFLSKSYNKHYYPWANMEEDKANKIIIFAMSAFLVNGVTTIGCCLYGYYRFKLNMLKDAVELTRKKFTLCFVMVMSAQLFPLIMIPYHSNTWFYFFGAYTS